MEIKEIKSIIESMLFTWGDPLELKDIACILEIDEKNLMEIIDEMIVEFDYNFRGLKIIKMNSSYQIVTRPENFEWIKKLTTDNSSKSLSNATLETLSIIAYRQPIIKSDIEAIRGVRCDRSIETLIDKGMVKEIGRLEKVGKPIIYGTTDVFLRSFGLEKIDDLPSLDDFKEKEDIIDKSDNTKK